MFRDDPNCFQLILKDGTDLSPCVICYCFDSCAENFMRDHETQIPWKKSERPYHWVVPENFKFGDLIEVGFKKPHYQIICLLRFSEASGKRLRFTMLQKNREELEAPAEENSRWMR